VSTNAVKERMQAAAQTKSENAMNEIIFFFIFCSGWIVDVMFCCCQACTVRSFLFWFVWLCVSSSTAINDKARRNRASDLRNRLTIAAV
jgi:hypothetical protein